MRTLALVTVIGLCAGACGDTAGPEHPSMLTTIELTPESVGMTDTGQKQQLTAVLKDQNGNVMTGITLFWSARNSGVATVDQDGLVTSGEKTCVATITAAATNVHETIIESNGVRVEVSHPRRPTSGASAPSAASGCGASE